MYTGPHVRYSLL